MKYVFPYVCLAGVALVAALIILLLPKDKPLTISAKDVSLSVGESKTMEYELSVSFAIVKSDASNPEIAKIERNKIVGVAAGETTIMLVAEYNGKTADCSFKVVVTASSQMPDGESPSEDPEAPTYTPPEGPEDEQSQTPGDNPTYKPDEGAAESPDENDDSGNSGASDPADNPEEPEVDVSVLSFSVIPEINCSFENKLLLVVNGKTAYFNISFDVDENDEYFDAISAGEYTLTSAVATISRMSSGMGWKISASDSGTIDVVIDGKVVCSFDFIVS